MDSDSASGSIGTEAPPSSPVAVNEGAEDVVEADVAVSDAHHTHLVEGDFFPSEAPTVDGDALANDGGVDDVEEDASVDEIAAEAAAAVAAASISSTPPKPAAPPPRKRVRWADGCDAAAAHGLVKHVTSFYMPSSSRGHRFDDTNPSSPNRPAYAAAAVNPAPSIFRDKVNADGTTYQFCKAQRPAARYVEWKRQHHEYGATPFEPQPIATAEAAQSSSSSTSTASAATRTLFGALFQRSVVTRVAEGQVRTRRATHHGGDADTFQLPFVRTDAVFDEPLVVPLPQ